MPPSEPSAAPTATDPVEIARRRGRLVGIVGHAALLSAFTLVCTVQILQQAWADA
ncbi:MAG: hypothetical protein FJ104_07090, partial [Deltaproteobacteria bacterium]|nr:hypothetical protein [Deltaproteobacteria bacterium]